jgi:pyruvate oxidase
MVWQNIYPNIQKNKVNGAHGVPRFYCMKKKKVYICKDCGYCYDENDESIPFEDVPDDYRCPICQAPKDHFYPLNTENPDHS